VEDYKLIALTDRIVSYTKKGLILMGDVNFPHIGWDIFHSISNSQSSQMFIHILQKNSS